MTHFFFDELRVNLTSPSFIIIIVVGIQLDQDSFKCFNDLGTRLIGGCFIVDGLSTHYNQFQVFSINDALLRFHLAADSSYWMNCLLVSFPISK